MVIVAVTKWWDRSGNKDKKTKINEIITAINANASAISGHTTDIAARLGRDPDYDSGWFSLTQGGTVEKGHGQSSRHLFVYLVGENTSSVWHNRDIGGNFGLVSSHPHERYGGRVEEITTTNIKVKRQPEDWTGWEKFRVLVWKLA